MAHNIEEAFERLEHKISLFIKGALHTNEQNEKLSSLANENIKLKERLKYKEKECEESQHTFKEIARKLYGVILAMKSTLNDAD